MLVTSNKCIVASVLTPVAYRYTVFHVYFIILGRQTTNGQDARSVSTPSMRSSSRASNGTMGLSTKMKIRERLYHLRRLYVYTTVTEQHFVLVPRCVCVSFNDPRSPLSHYHAHILGLQIFFLHTKLLFTSFQTSSILRNLCSLPQLTLFPISQGTLTS